MDEYIKQLEYPTDPNILLGKKTKIKKYLLENFPPKIKKNIAVLGGSTTHDIVKILELFLLYNGIEAEFYECEYNQYYEDIMYNNKFLKEFKPDIIWLHTSYRNIENIPCISDSEEIVNQKLEAEYNKYLSMWQKCNEDYKCIIIQNNFEQPFMRILGNKDVSDCHGLLNFISRLNLKLYDFAQTNNNFYINDLNFVASNYGLKDWHDLSAWYLYKYCCKIEAIPYLSHNVSRIIKSIYGKNKKGFVLDLDNTLWGGIVGDDGVENLELGTETATAQAYTEFQLYLKKLSSLGVILNINSKNEKENAIAGLNHPDGILKPNDFICIKANWNPKSQNMTDIAEELSLGTDSLVFVDDNPAEREIVKTQVKGSCVPEISQVEFYIKEIDRIGFFEVTALSKDDLSKNDMYKANMERVKLKQSFNNYNDYLLSLDMKAVIKPFEPVYMQRIAQLTNKSNQFNLTTKRYSQTDIEKIALDKNYVTLYGKLLDKFGDNGVVSVVIGKIVNDELHIDLWLMSCRVLKRDMEFAMMDELILTAKKLNISKIFGYYYPTNKNAMVKDFYQIQGFSKIKEDDDGNTVWEYDIPENYKNKNEVICVNDSEN